MRNKRQIRGFKGKRKRSEKRLEPKNEPKSEKKGGVYLLRCRTIRAAHAGYYSGFLKKRAPFSKERDKNSRYDTGNYFYQKRSEVRDRCGMWEETVNIGKTEQAREGRHKEYQQSTKKQKTLLAISRQITERGNDKIDVRNGKGRE